MAEKSRTIHYYVIEPLNPDTPRWPRNGDIAATIRNKLATPLADPYISLTAGTYIVEQHSSRPLQVSISTVRRDNLPNREHHGHSDPLPLPDDQNLAEPTNLVFFESNVVGVVRSTTTPGHLKVSSVLSKRINVDVILTPILRPEIEALIVNSAAVSKLNLRIAGSSFNAQLADAGTPWKEHIVSSVKLVVQ